VPFTWTIYANAFRVADAIMQDLKTSLGNRQGLKA